MAFDSSMSKVIGGSLGTNAQMYVRRALELKNAEY
jgi:hypothetical protein